MLYIVSVFTLNIFLNIVNIALCEASNGPSKGQYGLMYDGWHWRGFEPFKYDPELECHQFDCTLLDCSLFGAEDLIFCCGRDIK